MNGHLVEGLVVGSMCLTITREIALFATCHRPGKHQSEEGTNRKVHHGENEWQLVFGVYQKSDSIK